MYGAVHVPPHNNKFDNMSTQAPLKLLGSLLVVGVLVLTSCGDGEAKRTELLKKAAEDLHEVRLIEGYYSSDVKKAEESLLGLAQLYSSARFEKVDGANGTRALTHTRLYLLYSQTQRTNEAAVHRSEALKLYLGSPEQTEQERWTELLHAVEMLDKDRQVKWKALHDRNHS